MTSPAEPGRAGGFTLIEMLVVLVVLGLAVALVTARGPARPRGMDLRAGAAELADTLRLARARAIAGNQPTQVLISAEEHIVQGADGRLHRLPTEIAIAFHSLTGPMRAPAMAIRFAPDGSSSGGAVELTSGGRSLLVRAGWLAGRVRVADVTR